LLEQAPLFGIPACRFLTSQDPDKETCRFLCRPPRDRLALPVGHADL